MELLVPLDVVPSSPDVKSDFRNEYCKPVATFQLFPNDIVAERPKVMGLS